ncbi:MAG: NAD-dependent DNA ligase LigA [Candidatus Omnitrophica bacterium]|nr:NAD-dependent DNA ligase LigA [Candidatus Omnitrophota bacterium]
MNSVEKQIQKLRESIRHHDWRYYVISDPEISDKEYDELFKNLQSLEEKHPEFITNDSPTQRVSGGVLEGFSTVSHREKMLSLDNTYSIDELKEWESRIKRAIKRDVAFEYMVELKIDGVSCSLTYQDGALILGATRGDGQIGEDVTANIRAIKSIPLKLRGDSLSKFFEVRGEIYMQKTDFNNLNRQRSKRGDPPFANPRNATSGSLKLLDSSSLPERNLNCFMHSFGWMQGGGFAKQNDFLNKIKTWGLRVNPANKVCRNIQEVIEYCLYWQTRRDNLDYEVDGVVVKVNDFNQQKELGATSKSPRWAVAYKFPAHQTTTKVVSVSIQVGRTGILTPVANLTPVECAGVMISRATLHNFDEVNRLDVRIGDTILLQRSGDVIPKIVKVITSKRTGKEVKFVAPRRCPICKTLSVKEKSDNTCLGKDKSFYGVYIYCPNPDCPAQIKRSLWHFASRGAMDIEGMGKSVVDALVDIGMVGQIVDIYKLEKADFLKLPLFKEKRADNLVRAIKKSKEQPLSKVLYGLGIKHVGERAAMLLANRFKSIDKFFGLNKNELEVIDEIGPVMAASIVEFFSSTKIKKMIQLFSKLGLKLVAAEKTIIDNDLKGKVFVFTGELIDFSRSNAKAAVEAKAGKCTTSISKNVDYLVVGKNPGSKHAKAKKLNIPIVNEEEFKTIVGLRPT